MTAIPTTIQVHEIDVTTSQSTGSHTGSPETDLVKRLTNEKRSTLSLIKTSHPVVTSSPIREMTSRKGTVETPKDVSTPSKLVSSIREAIRSSELLKIEASSLLNKQETSNGLSAQEEQIFLSQTMNELTSSQFTEIKSSSVFQQIFSSETKEEITTLTFLEITTSPIIKEEGKSSSQSAKAVMSTSSPVKRPLSSQTTEKLSSSKVLQIESSPVVKDKETASLIAKPAASKERESSPKQILISLGKEEMTSSQLVTTTSTPTSLLDEKDEVPLKTVQATAAFKIEPSSLGLKEMTSLPKKVMVSSKLVKPTTSSGALEPASLKTSSSPSQDDGSLQQIEDTATPQLTETRTPSKLSKSLVSTAVVAALTKRSSQKAEDMTSPSLRKLMVSSRLLASSKVIRSTPVKTTTEHKHLDDMTSLQSKNTMTSSRMGTPTQVMTSFQVNKEITLSSSQISSLLNTKTPLLKTNIVMSSKSIKNLTSSQTLIPTSFKEMNIVISALILSSSQIADLITTSSAAESTEGKELPTTEKTKPLDEEKTTTTTKLLATSQLPEKKTTTPSEMNTSGKKSIAMTTSHPTHPPVHPSKPKHHTKPIHPGDATHHGDKNNTNKTDDGHVVKPGSHGTMGFPDEPTVVEASTNEKDDNSWQISVVVVCSLIIGMVSFVIVWVVKSNRELKR